MPRSTIAQRLTALGFTLVNTGGNCTAWEYDAGGDRYFLLTTQADPSAPTRLAEMVTLGEYVGDESEPAPYRHARLRDLLNDLEAGHPIANLGRK